MSEAEFEAFWDTSSQYSFGYLFSTALAEIAENYGCRNSANCTAPELAALQWGSSYVTANPKDTWSPTYMPTATTVTNWGDSTWLPYGPMPSTDIPEYNNLFSQEIKKETAMRLMSNSFQYYGLARKVNCQTLAKAYFTGDSATLDAWQ